MHGRPGPPAPPPSRSPGRPRRRRGRRPPAACRASDVEARRQAAQGRRAALLHARHPLQRHAAAHLRDARTQHRLARRVGAGGDDRGGGQPRLLDRADHPLLHAGAGRPRRGAAGLQRGVQRARPGASWNRTPCWPGTWATTSTQRPVRPRPCSSPRRSAPPTPSGPSSPTSGTAAARLRQPLQRLMLGMHRWPLLTSLELDAYRDWLEQPPPADARTRTPGRGCRRTCRTGTTASSYDGDEQKTPPTEPIGPQPEQIRLLAYIALGGRLPRPGVLVRPLPGRQPPGPRPPAGAGPAQPGTATARADPRPGDQRRAGMDRHVAPEVKAAVLRTPQGVLVLPMWLGSGSQFVPGQAAAAELSSPCPVADHLDRRGRCRRAASSRYPIKRVQGGCEVTLHNFSLTSALLFTSDLGRTAWWCQLQDKQRAMGRLAAQWPHDQAKEELAKVERTFDEDRRAGPRPVRRRRSCSRRPRGAGEAQQPPPRRRARRGVPRGRGGAAAAAPADARPTGTGRCATWTSPVASPYAVSFFTLPRHWELLDQLEAAARPAHGAARRRLRAAARASCRPAGWCRRRDARPGDESSGG